MTSMSRALTNPSKSFATLILILGLCFSQTGCGWFFGEEGVFRNRSNNYLKADKIPPLVLPEGKSSASMGEIYPIPPISATDFGYDSSMDNEIPRPLPLAANLREDKVRIQRVGGESWVLINAAPGELWPRIRNFLNVNGLNANYTNINKGIIETEWLQFKTDPGIQHVYRLQMDQGVQPETSEIHITHFSLPSGQPLPTEINWPAKSTSSEKEKWLMDELAAALANDDTEGGTSLLAQNIGGAVKANMGMLRTEPVIYIRLDRVRALATLSFAAKKDGFVTFESNNKAGLFYVGYKDPEDLKPGWFTRKLHLPFKPKLPTTEYQLEQLREVLPQGEALDGAPLSKRSKEKTLPDADGYLLIVSGDENNYVVRIRDPYGKRLAPKEARELLTILRKNLI
jgi:outer membrane protein assembly factor BamC